MKLGASATNWGEWSRRAELLGISLILILAVSACGVGPNEQVPNIPNAKSIIECGLDRVTPALKDSPNALQRAAKVYDLIDRGRNVVDAVRYAYAKDLYDLNGDELNEAILIL